VIVAVVAASMVTQHMTGNILTLSVMIEEHTDDIHVLTVDVQPHLLHIPLDLFLRLGSTLLNTLVTSQLSLRLTSMEQRLG
jgi:hypothetical protein